MKVSFNWLKELVDIRRSAEDAARQLEELGLEVAGVTHVGEAISGVIAAKILEVKPHPNADRLSVCQVNDGKNQLTIVCGAKNIAPGQTVPLATIGAKVAGGQAISKSAIRGVESSGMLCSARELGLSEDHSGILLLDADTKLGKPVTQIFPLTDTILEVEITPNRADCLSHIGIARELAAASGKSLKTKPAKTSKAGSGKFPIQIEKPADCFRYIGTVVKGVTVKPSPVWLARRLALCGIRSINNIVDITNYVLLETGHPLHAFDLSKLEGGKIVVRRARAGENIAALDEKTYTLSPETLVIADENKPLAVAGVIGGQPSAIQNETVDILLESACFDRSLVRRASKSLAVRTESSYRFERGTHPASAESASKRALELIVELAGGKVESTTDVYPKKRSPVTVSLRPARLNSVLDTHFKTPEIKKNLESLGFACRPGKKGMLSCTVPTWRLDVEGEHDLIEEVARLKGYAHIEERLPTIKLSGLKETAQFCPSKSARQVLLSNGFWEACSSTFVSGKNVRSLDPLLLQTAVAVANPLSEEQEYLRPCLSLGLLLAVKKNRSQGINSLKLFEVGSAFEKIGAVTDAPAESHRLALVIAGDYRAKHWRETTRPVDYFEVKSWCELLLEDWGQHNVKYSPVSLSFLHPGASATLSINGTTLGWAGLTHPGVAKALDISLETVVAEFDFAAVVSARKTVTFQELPKYPPVKRDLSFVVNKNVTWEQIETCARESAGETLVAIHPFDVFSGGSLGADEKSLAFSLSLRRTDKTLTDTEADELIQKTVGALQSRLSARLR